MCTQVPAQILCPQERAAKCYINCNARVDDPVEWLRQERLLKPWTPEEKRIFNEKFLVHPKVCRARPILTFPAACQAMRRAAAIQDQTSP